MQVKKEITGQQAYQKLTALCARGEHCEQDMIDKMRQWGVGDEEQAQVLARLIEERYVDNERFTRAFVYDKLRYNKWGRRKIEQALWLKHINDAVARSILDEVDDDEYLRILRPMLKQKRRGLAAKSDYEANMKLIKYAMGRGFSMDLIRQCISVGNEDEYLDENL